MMDEQLKYIIKSTIIKNIIYIIFILTIFLIIRYSIYIAKKAVEKDEDFNKNLFPFIIFCLMFIGSFNGIAEKYEKIQKSLVISEKLFKIIDYIPNIRNTSKNKYSFMKINGNIEFNNINFSYPNKKEVEVLNNFNLKISPGMRLGIVGASGSGKSTIISLLQRLYDYNNSNKKIINNLIANNKEKKQLNKLNDYIELPNINSEALNLLNSKLIDSDSELISIESDINLNKNEPNNSNNNSNILIDNINIELLDLKNFHNQIGYVPQEPPLFNTTTL